VPFVVPPIVTPGSTDRSVLSGSGGEPSLSSLPSASASSFGPRPGSAELLPSGSLHSARSASALGEAMVLAVLQTVSSELLLLLQHEFDLLAPAATPRGGQAGGETQLDPAHLLTVCQELLLAQPASLAESQRVAAELSQLLAELVPHLADRTHTPHLTTLGDSLAEFVAALPERRGEELLRAEDVMLRAIRRATDRDEATDMSDE
jgi:hypothetical protein